MSVILSNRERKMILFCVISLMLFGIFTGVLRPVISKSIELEEDLKAKAEYLNKYLVKIKKEKEFESQNQSLLNALRSADAPDKAMSFFVSEVEKTAGPLEIKILDLQPQKIKEEEFFNSFLIKISIRGEFLNILEFVHTLQNKPCFFIFEEFLLENNNLYNKDYLLKAQFTLTKKIIFKPDGESFVINKNFVWGNNNDKEISPRSFATYLFLKQRNIFQPPGQQGQKDAVDLIQEFREQYQCSGIVLDKEPLVIIQEKKNKKVIFLSEGDEINGFFLQEIREDKIILKKQQQTIEVDL
ncbi:MAG TPA: type 4a pilus biogenesis protein PilO [Candidatus Omnitrophota bacterium]|nr:type 4a pilus biogenesis protein PilO [Candidatus Omnitrophota bacterium]HPN88200.1 type 4a pilus biogenesis protein PilO [Candidatus Omnitrophota bacterium]